MVKPLQQCAKLSDVFDEVLLHRNGDAGGDRAVISLGGLTLS